jgi:hypothetical protein
MQAVSAQPRMMSGFKGQLQFRFSLDCGRGCFCSNGLLTALSAIEVSRVDASTVARPGRRKLDGFLIEADASGIHKRRPHLSKSGLLPLGCEALQPLGEALEGDDDLVDSPE